MNTGPAINFKPLQLCEGRRDGKCERKELEVLPPEDGKRRGALSQTTETLNARAPKPGMQESPPPPFVRPAGPFPAMP